MKIEIRNLKHIASRSEETLCFSARLFVNDVLTAELDNDGNGGSNRVIPINKQLYDEFETYVKSIDSDTDIDCFLSLLVATELELIDRRKNFKKGICFLKPNQDTDTYSMVGWNESIKWIIDNNQSKVLQDKVDQLLSEGCTILNDNLTGIKITK